jgi:TRAP-type C4-dicarboxylate transport system substrate-binding protein
MPASRTSTAVALGVLPVILAVAACGVPTRAGNADKAGGPTAPTVLTLGTDVAEDEADARVLGYFVHAVAQHSHDRLRVHVVYRAGGGATAFREARVARAVRDGRFDLGWVGSRVWDELGVRSLRALQTPFLITDYVLLDRVLTSPLGTSMLEGTGRAGVVGLALVPGELRHPLGVTHSLVSRADFAGARIDVPPSRTTDALVRALGAKPVHLSRSAGFAAYVAGRVDGKEFGYLGELGPIVTPNVTLFPTADTLVGNEDAVANLDGALRRALEAAAVQTVEHVAGTPPSEEQLLKRFCAEGGRAAVASPGELAELQAAAEPVVAELERDAETRRFIRAIRVLKTAIPRNAGVRIPDGCRLLER